MFGEVYDADPTKLSPYVRTTDMDSVLDFYFQQQAWGVQAPQGRGLILFLPRPPGHTSTRCGQRMCKDDA